jgi:hypothetical protein
MISQYVKNSPSTFMHLYRLQTKLKNRALVFATIQKYQFPLMYYFGMQQINLEMWLVNFPKSFPRLVLRSQPSLMCWANRRHLHHACYGRPFSNSLRHFVSCRTLVTSSSYTIYQPAVNFWVENTAHPYEPNHSTSYGSKFSSVTNSPHELHLTDAPSVAHYPYCQYCQLPKYEMLQ